MDDVIDISSGDEDQQDAQEQLPKREILSHFIQSTVAALGGYVNTPEGRVYEMGDSCLGCLKDLKKFWRKDENDPDRMVARIFWETRVLPNDLVPILLETAGKGSVMDKRAVACADLLTAMTWPIDVAEELKELDEDREPATDYAILLRAQLAYKASLLQPGALSALVAIMTPALAKTKRDRTERDGQIINVILHAFRNLAFIKDTPDIEQVEFSSLQSKLITEMQNASVLEVLTTLTANANDSLFNPYNVILLEIYYLLFRGVKPHELTVDLTKPRDDLKNLLALEETTRRAENRQGATRHSRFGTTVTIKSGKDQFIVHKQIGIVADPTSVMGREKIKAARKGKRQDELASFEQLSVRALAALQEMAISFLDSSFEAFFSSLLKDIKSERAKITEYDNIRLLVVVRWFLEFFLSFRAKELDALPKEKIRHVDDKGKTREEFVTKEYEYEELRWRFEMVGEVVERSWVGWVLRRMRMAMEDKPKQWTELRAGMDFLGQLLLLLDQMSLPESPDFAHETSQTLQHQLYYSGEILEIAFDSLKGYKEQSIAYLESSIHLAYLLLRMLERWAKTQGQMYIRKSKGKKKAAKKVGDTDGVVADVGSDDDDPSRPGGSLWNEHMFTFEKFESKFAVEDITHACLAYLQRYREFNSPDEMKRVVSLMHRQAVKSKAEGLFFKVSTLELFNRILDDQKTFPADLSYKELIQFVNFILRRFFKAMEESPMLLVEAFYPKNRGQWKQFSSYVPDEKEASASARKNAQGPAADVQVKKGYSEEEQLGIAVAVLVEQEKRHLVDWVRATIMMVQGIRLAIVKEVEEQQETPVDADLEQRDGTSREALSKFEDYSIPYVNEEYAQAATKDPYLKLVLRLISCYVVDPEADELDWYFPAAITPEDLQKHLDVIARYLDEPLDLGGKSATDMLSKKHAKRTSTRRSRRADASSSEDEAQRTDDEERPKRRMKKRQKEESQYKSAEFIDDSDQEGDDAEFYRKEEEIRKRAQTAAETGTGGHMRSTGTKKRKRGKGAITPSQSASQSVPVDDVDGGDDEPRASTSSTAGPTAATTPPPTTPPSNSSRKRVRRASALSGPGGGVDGISNDSDSDVAPQPVQDSPADSAPAPARPRPRPRPRARPRPARASSSQSSSPGLEARGSSLAPPSTAAGSSDLDIDADSGPASMRDSASPPPMSNGDGVPPSQAVDPPGYSDDDELEISLTRPAARRKTVVILSDEEE